MVVKFDWPYILYTGMVWLGYTEQEVWQLTPRKWKALTDVHIKQYKQQWGVQDDSAEAVNTGYIDEIGF